MKSRGLIRMSQQQQRRSGRLGGGLRRGRGSSRCAGARRQEESTSIFAEEGYLLVLNGHLRRITVKLGNWTDQ